MARSIIDMAGGCVTITAMNNDNTKTPGLPDGDAQAVLDHLVAGTPIDPELARRVRERAEDIRRQILATHGVQEIGVELIRQLRGELPES
jgi:hypothetical protein